MFRSKKKNVGGRKRRDVGADNQVSAAFDDIKKSHSDENLTLGDSEAIRSDLHVLENLRHTRSRATKTTMTFSSKSMSAEASRGSIYSGEVSAEINGLLSFADEEHSEKKKQKKRKMRPNLVASSTVNGEMEEDPPRQYSAEMLSSLRNEQSVTNNELQMDVKMHEVEQESEAEMEHQMLEEEEEDFIALDKGNKKTRHSTNRVTFGEQLNDEEIPNMEITEELSEEEDQNIKWEEELMRRGGHGVSSALESKECHSLPIYPTRKKVTCVTLGSVLGKLERNLETSKAESERVSRELVRLKAEKALIETTVEKQKEELAVSSKEFEYFQKIEDFVKGLSFCLREKLPVIQANEKRILDERVKQVKTCREEENHGIQEDLNLFLHSGVLQQSDIFGLNHVDLLVNGDAASNDTKHAERMHKYRQHYIETDKADPRNEEQDFFADTIDELNSIERVYGQFQEWKATFPEVYESTYCELAQEKLLAPYVKAELLYWDPLRSASAESKKSIDEFSWFRVLKQHVHQPSQNHDTMDGLIIYQVRDVLLKKVIDAVSSYFDPYSSLQVRSLLQVLDDVRRYGFSVYVEDALNTIIKAALESFSRAANCTVLVAIDQNIATSHDNVNVLARYLLERFNTLLDNLLDLFVGLPKGPIASAGFRCLLKRLHQLLAYVQFCQKSEKMQQIATATQVVRQLSGSSYLHQLLSEPSQERELKHIMTLFTPFLHISGSEFE
ncbi:Transcriptional regulators binding to the GC-rich sequences [Plasmopara halstedii]|uniref:Transcriptional regulators binding to the GC-rich sequences n=1 Tax=Plasmopara halstedii TaxID=4781 RepID=A0A0P1B6P3_PLAHL|nr:Transcriptional regulators binding to the GC-rich sequences [Plasmopara halstedii]CEG49756.1 Transcriptional regulators binding to the GC-rich sequences [Plasmopara halstedii]|eukprot:XP_024586125.1 Transcriptional regulators binding to the GC-rich sequences [Plasmopara halstedii]